MPGRWFLLVILALALVGCTESGREESFPFSFALSDLEGNRVSLDDFKGKVVIVDIWGTWCLPCQQEIPHFIHLREKYRDRGLEMVGINYEDGNEAEVKATIQQFVADHGINYTCLIGDEATRSQIPNFEGYPTTLFLDRTGKVRRRLVGLQSLDTLEEIVAELVAESAPS